MTTARSTDPLLFTLPEAAAFCGMDRRTFWRRLRVNPEFRRAIDSGLGGRRWISRPRLEAWARGERIEVAS